MTTGIEITAEELSHMHGQSSAVQLAQTGRGDCFAYAKLQIINDPILNLYLQRDCEMGLHFGAIDLTELPTCVTLDHLRDIHPVRKQLELSDELTQSLTGDSKVVRMLRPRSYTVENTYTICEDGDSPTALVISERPFLFLQYLGKHYDRTAVWQSVMNACVDFEIA